MAEEEGVGPSRRLRALWLVPALVLGLAGLLLWLNLSGLARTPGFLGTRATLAADVNLLLEILLIAGLLSGFFIARKGDIQLHQYNQTAWVLVNMTLLAGIMYGSYHQQVEPGVPEKLRQAYYGVGFLHMLVGGLAISGGAYLLLRMNGLLPKALRVKWWKNLMRATLGMYAAAGLVGLGTYYVWYVSPPSATGAPEAISQANAVTVPLANFEFVPREITVPVGATLLFFNQDPAPHTVTFDDGSVDSGSVDSGGSYVRTFDAVGTFPFYCAFHGGPGGINMAGVVHVGPAAEVAALPSKVVPPPPTPAPTPAPPPASQDYFGPGVTGFVGFRDDRARSDQVYLSFAGVQPPSGGQHLEGWLRTEDGYVDLGQLPVSAAGGVEASYTHSSRGNLVATATGYVITLETAAATEPSVSRLAEGEIPKDSVVHVRQLLAGFESAPHGQALMLGLLTGVDNLSRQTSAGLAAAQSGDLATAHRVAEHMVNMIEGKTGTNFGDLDGDGGATDPSDGYGLLSYAEGSIAQARMAIEAADATENVKAHGGHVMTTAGNVLGWLIDLRDRALELAATDDAGQAAELLDRIAVLASGAVNGVDANGDGKITPTPGEGGAYTGYFHAQYMAAMGVVTEEIP